MILSKKNLFIQLSLFFAFLWLLSCTVLSYSSAADFVYQAAYTFEEEAAGAHTSSSSIIPSSISPPGDVWSNSFILHTYEVETSLSESETLFESGRIWLFILLTGCAASMFMHFYMRIFTWKSIPPYNRKLLLCLHHHDGKK